MKLVPFENRNIFFIFYAPCFGSGIIAWRKDGKRLIPYKKASTLHEEDEVKNKGVTSYFSLRWWVVM